MKCKRNPNAFLGVGLAIGAGLGVAFHNIAFGVAIGLLLGSALRAVALRRGE